MSKPWVTTRENRASAKYKALHAQLARELKNLDLCDHFSGRVRNHARDSKTFKLRGALQKELI